MPRGLQHERNHSRYRLPSVRPGTIEDSDRFQQHARLKQYAPTAYGFAGSSLQVRIHKPIFALSLLILPVGPMRLVVGGKIRMSQSSASRVARHLYFWAAFGTFETIVSGIVLALRPVHEHL